MKENRLQFITHCNERFTHLESAQMALKGGCKWIQLRMKEANDSEWLNIGKKVGQLCKLYGATYILDDRVDLVKPLNADGVHLGKNDLPIDKARIYLGEKYIIGGTANTLTDIIMQAERGANYIGCGPFRFTTTKANLSPLLGLEGYKSIIKEMKRIGLHIPIYAIGGIERNDIPSIMGTGMTGIAMSGTILRATNPEEETNLILKELENSLKY